MTAKSLKGACYRTNGLQTQITAVLLGNTLFLPNEKGKGQISSFMVEAGLWRRRKEEDGEEQEQAGLGREEKQVEEEEGGEEEEKEEEDGEEEQEQ